MDNFPSNSNKAKAPEPKKVEKIVDSSRVTRRKKPLGKRISEMFFQEDGRSVLAYIIQEVIIPSTKDIIVDTVTESVDRAVYGDTRPKRSVGRGHSPSRVSYSSISNNWRGSQQEHQDSRRQVSRRARETHSFDDILLDSRAEATEILDQMFTMLSKYEQVSVADLYGMLDTTADFTDEKWGWTDLRGSDVAKVRGGWLLDLPRPIELN